MEQFGNYINNVFASLVCIVHIIIFILILYIPIFSNSNYFIFFCAVFLPFLELHWIFNNDICCLTELEKKIRGINNNESFINKLLSPIYKFPNNNNSLSDISYFVINILICICFIKLYDKYKNEEIKEFWDLYKI